MAKNCTYFDKDTSVRGDLTTSHVIVEGTFEGKIIARDKILLKESVQINAEINTPKLIVEDGAQYEGSIFLTNNDG